MSGVDNASDADTISGEKCVQCGFSSVPETGFGCQRCGGYGEDLIPTAFNGTGTLLQSIVVYQHPNPNISTPYAVGNIQLDEGPIFRMQVIGPGALDAPLADRRGGLVNRECEGTGTGYVFAVSAKDGEEE